MHYLTDWAEEAWSSPWAANLDSRSAYLDAPTAAAFSDLDFGMCSDGGMSNSTLYFLQSRPVPLELWGTGTPAQSARSDL